MSPDGLKLVTSYINISNGVLQSSLNFYNFDEAGQTSVDRIVGSRPMDKELVANIDFVNSDIVCAYTETGFKLYQMREVPQDIADIKLDNSIKSVCHNKEYVGVVLENTEGMDMPYILQIYDTKGQVVLEKYVDYDYNRVEMGEDEIIFYSGKSCNIVRTRGSEKLDCVFENEISNFFPLEGSDNYIIIDGENMNEVHLTGSTKGD